MRTSTLILLGAAWALSSCGMDTRNLAAKSGGYPTTHIDITAEAGSEVVVSKYVGLPDGGFGTETAPLDAELDASEIPAFTFLPTSLDTTPVPVEVLESGTEVLPPAGTITDAVIPATVDIIEPPDPRPSLPVTLGEIRIEPWAVHPGETLLDALQRFARRSGYSVQKAVGSTTWEITTPASFEGDFEGALNWLMTGFAHTDPRPVLTLHPNQVVRLSVE